MVLTDLVSEPLTYVMGVLLGVIGWFANDKISSLEDRVSKMVDLFDTKVKGLEVRGDGFEMSVQDSKIKLLEYQLKSQNEFVSKAEYLDSQNKLYAVLGEISKDVKDIITGRISK